MSSNRISDPSSPAFFGQNNRHHSKSRASIEVDDYLNQLLVSGKGCNLTIYNPNPIKEIEDQEDDVNQVVDRTLAMNNSASSFM